MPHHQLVMDDGEALGPVELEGSADDWPNGRILRRPGEPDMRVVGYLECDGCEYFDVLVVEWV